MARSVTINFFPFYYCIFPLLIIFFFLSQELQFPSLSEVNKENILDLIAKQREEILRLTQLNQNGAKENIQLKTASIKVEALQRKCKSLTKVNKKLQSQVSARSWSPWLSKSQQKLLMRKSTRGVKWDAESVREGLILKMKCGNTGYTSFVQKYPLLPSARYLQDSVKFMTFDSGLLNEVFDLLEEFAKSCSDQEKDCQIVLDEMALEEGERWDPSTKKFQGQATFPTHTGRATKALVIMLAGISKRWKIAVAVYFTSKRAEEYKQKKGQKYENHTGEAFSSIVNKVIRRTEATTLRVSGITSDMGPDNLSMWRANGISGRKQDVEVKCSFTNPARPESKIYVMPDAVHLFKSIKTALESNGVIILPPEIVAEEGLSSSVVDYKHIDDLYQHEKDCELKVAFRLKPELIHCKKQFPTMAVGTSKAVICNRTGVGLKLMAEDKKNADYLTTAWFIMLLNTFFELVTCRGGPLKLCKSHKSYPKAIHLIKKMDRIFQGIHIGKKGEWKPCQRGMRVLCASLLGLQDYFLNERGYNFILLARFTQDCIENLFSLIRLRQPTPHAVTFLQCLKVITLAQYSIAVKGSSYEYEESIALEGIDFLAEARRRAIERAEERITKSLDELFANAIEPLSLIEINSLSEWEEAVIYDMAGSVIRLLQESRCTFCNLCLNATKTTAHHPRAIVTEMKEFTELRSDDSNLPALQIYVTDEVFKAILIAEITFRKHRQATLNFEHSDILQYFVENLMYVWKESSVPDCHNILRKILETFITGRLKEFGKKRREEVKADAKKTVNRSSKSVAYREAVNFITKDSSFTA
jgi:hypothetical protein